eukprot:1795303-Rhodomonas_salina.1
MAQIGALHGADKGLCIAYIRGFARRTNGALQKGVCVTSSSEATERLPPEWRESRRIQPPLASLYTSSTSSSESARAPTE